MSSSLSQCPDAAIKEMALRAGAFRVGFAEAAPVDASLAGTIHRRAANGLCGDMLYLCRNADLMCDPANVLPGVKTIISMAFPYAQKPENRSKHVAEYALGRDYHIVLRERLAPVAGFISARFGALTRICVDSAPLPERYWAAKAGLGFVADNGFLTIPGHGSGFFLAEILTTLSLTPDSPIADECLHCGACASACPGGALRCGSDFDARCCQSYLTIESKSEIPADQNLGSRIYGCDICRLACPLSRGEIPEPLEEFSPRPEILALDREAVLAMGSAAYRRLTDGSAMRRVPLSRLKRNARHAGGRT